MVLLTTNFLHSLFLDKASGYHYGVTSCEGCKVSIDRAISIKSSICANIDRTIVHVVSHLLIGVFSAQHTKTN